MTVNHRKYRGSINLKNGQQRVVVECYALNNNEAKKIIESQYAGQFKSWAVQMARV